MARIRSTHPGQWTDEDFVTCSPLARLLCIAIRNEADDKGIFEWKPITLKMRLLPADSADVSELLEELVAAKQVKPFEIEGAKYGAIRNFRKYQRPKTPNDIYPMLNDFRKYVGLKKPNSGKASESGDVKGKPISEMKDTSSGSISETLGKTTEQMEEGGGRRLEEGDTTTNTGPVSEKGGDVVLPEDQYLESHPVNTDLAAPKLLKRPRLEDQFEAKELPQSPGKPICDAYMTVVGQIFGTAHTLTHPGHGATLTANRWIEAGADLALCVEVFQSILAGMKEKGRQPPNSLKYFEQPVADAIKQASAPMPEGGAQFSKFNSEPEGLHPDSEANKWRFRVERFKKDGYWRDMWGENPDDPDCECPTEILKEFVQ